MPTLTWLYVALTASLIVTEVLLVLALRDAVRELKTIRREIPRMLGALAAVTLLVEAARAVTLRKRD
jgi:hypothetical protein